MEVIRLQRQAAELQGKIDDARNQFAVRAREEQVKNNADLDAQIQVMSGKADQVDRASLFSPVRGIVKDIQVTTVGGKATPPVEARPNRAIVIDRTRGSFASVHRSPI